MKIFRFLPRARKELLDEISYYGSVQEGLGVRFEKAVTEAVRRAVENPEYGASRSKNTRRLLVKGFPFSIIYRVSESEVPPAHSCNRRFKTEAGILGGTHKVMANGEFQRWAAPTIAG